MKTIIVTGCARSGMTLMMHVLFKGGYPCYYGWPAFEKLGKIDWNEANGTAVKLVDTQMRFPPKGEYYVIRTVRDTRQQALSTCKFAAVFMKQKADYRDEFIDKIENIIKRDYELINTWAALQKDMVTVHFEEILKDPVRVIQQINERWELNLNLFDAIGAVIKRKPENYPGLLELTFLKKK